VSGGSVESPGWHWEQDLCGVIPPMLSPLDEQREPDAQGIRLLVEHILAGGCKGLFVLGGYGEGAWLTGAQREAVVRAAVAAAGGRAPVLVGVVLPATKASCEAAQQAESLGADAIVVGSPYYFGVDADAQVRHVEAVLKAVRLPVLLYNIPQCTYNPFAVQTVATLAQEPRVIGIKDSAGDLGAFTELLAIKQRRPGFRVLQGNGVDMLSDPPVMGDGIVAGLANIAPRLHVNLFNAAKAGDDVEVKQLQGRIRDLATLETIGPHFLAAAKAACATLGFGTGLPALPLERVGDLERQAIGTIVQRGLAEQPARV
jgi:dihydrodipicolinate synthase/N-acetylneuraminate lyase